MDYIDVLKNRLNRLLEEADALEQAIFLLESKNKKVSDEKKTRGKTKSGLKFEMQSKTIPAVNPAEDAKEEEVVDDFDYNLIPNKRNGILDL